MGKRAKDPEFIQQNEQTYRALHDHISVGVALISPQMEILSINRRIQGWFPALTIGNRPLCYQAFNLPSRNDICEGCPVIQTFKDGQLHESELEKRTPEGIRHYRIVATPLTDPDGRITAAIEMVEDITKQKRIEEMRLLDAERMESLLNLAQMSDQPMEAIIPFAVEESIHLTKSKIGYFAAVNQEETVLTMHYWSKSAHESCRIIDKPIVYPVEHTGLWGEAIRQRKPVITNDYASPNPCKRGTPEGHVPITRHMNIPVFDGGRIVAVAGVGNKPTDYDEGDLRQLKLLMDGMWRIVVRKQEQQALIERESEIKAITESAQDAVIMLDQDGKISYWNPAAERIFGYSRGEAISMKFHDCIAPQRYHESHRLAFSKFQKTGRGAAVGKTLELSACRKDGKEITVALSLSAVHVRKGWHAVGIVRDITDQKLAEEKLRRTMEELAEANHSLEAAITHANEMAFEAQSANISKSLFLANMSHEIRTPMNGVIGMTRLLLDTDLTEEQRRYCETVRASGEALLHVINDILDFSKIEAGKIELEELDFDIRAALEDTVELLALQAHEKQLEFTCRIDPDICTFLRGDPGRLRQILINLGSNAIKFTPRGEVDFEARLAEESSDLIKIRFEVRDTGIGIPSGKIGQLFNAFQQVDASTTRRFGGTGLGLAISKRLAELMGGEIGVESVEGQGSTFWFTAAFTRQQPKELIHEQRLVDIRHVRVLVVDDNATNRLILSEQLASWGMRHTEVGSGGKALHELYVACAAGDPYRIVLSDMQMPDMDGESLGKAIKADPAFKGTALIMMHSLGNRGKISRIKEIGFSAAVTKPVKQSQLYDCLSNVLGGIQPAKTAEISSISGPALSDTLRERARILLVEDNPTNQLVALRILEKLGFRADVMDNGLGAIQALEKASYDIVFMDVQMPIMDGFTATRAIRSGKTKIPNPGIPIIAMTAHAMQGDRERCLNAGMNDYLSKPIAPQALSEMLDKWLSQAAETQPTQMEQTKTEEGEIGPPVFDRDALANRLMGDEELIREICMGFLTDMPRQIDHLRQHIGNSDGAQAGGQSHTIKGAAANVGGMALSAAALDMEKAAKAGRWDKINPIMFEMERQFDLLKTRMEEHLS